MYGIDNPAERFYLLRFTAPVTDDEMTDFVADIRNIVRNAPEPLLFLTDNNDSDVWPKDAYDKFVWAMRMDNPNVLANIFVVPEGTPVEKFTRELVAEGRNERRQVVTSYAAALDLLGQHFTASERLAFEDYVSSR